LAAAMSDADVLLAAFEEGLLAEAWLLDELSCERDGTAVRHNANHKQIDRARFIATTSTTVYA